MTFLNYSQPAVCDAMQDAMLYWVDEAGVDGYRCDYAHGVPVDFWTKVNAEIFKRKKDAIMLAETSDVRLCNAGFNLLYSWSYMYAIEGLYRGTGTFASVLSASKSEYESTPKGCERMRYVTTHDETSQVAPATVFRTARGELSAFCLTIFMGGVPMIYSSQDLGYMNTINFFHFNLLDFAAENTAWVDGLILLAAYSTDPVALPVLSIYGSNDGVMNQEKYRQYRPNLPELTEQIIDGGNHTGQMTSMFALKKAMEKADKFGIGLALVKESSHNGAVGYYASLAAEAGYIALSTTTVMPLLAPWGGLEPFVGNNPYAIGYPYKEMPIVLDVSNSVTARQKIFSYAREGWKLPDGWAMDKDGNPTNDPQEAINGLLMPVGGHKGAGLALMIDLILGTLAGGTYARSICANTVPDKAQHIAHMIFVMNPDFYMSREALDAHTAQYVKDFRNVRKKADVEQLLLPGELEWQRIQDRKANGIPVSTAILAELNAFAQTLGVEPLEY